MAGFSQGGGMGLALAQWMIEGEVERDPRGFDVARFGNWTSPGYTVPKVIENYQMRFSVSYPNEERPAARPFRTTPMYEVFDGMNAVWGQQYGLEVVNYHALPGEPRYEEPTFRRSNAFPHVAEEVRTVRERVGLMDVVLTWNPFFHMLDAIRAPLMGVAPEASTFSVLIVMALAGWAVAFGLFTATRRRIVHYL
jgi:dimethylglycine dehydrogenase